MKTNRYGLLSLLVTMVWTLSSVADDKNGSKRPADKLFKAAAFLGHVKYLASDELGGRATGSEGIDVAADYIIEHLRAAGCVPAGDDGTFLQSYTATHKKVLVDDDASISFSGLKGRWRLHKDWVTLPFTKASELEGPLAFAGYGIEAPDYEYNDYADFDAEGKVLLILRHEPLDEDEEAEFGGSETSSHAWFRTKANAAAAHGAVGLLLVNPPNRAPDADELDEFDASRSRRNYKVPLVQISRQLANALLRAADMPDLATLTDKLDSDRKPLSADLKDLSVAIATGIELRPVVGRNVVGMLEGDGSTDEVIVIGAHYDHLGTRRPRQDPTGEPLINNGADDNASGTAGIIELARAFAAGTRPRRNLLFIAFSGEELGLLGSKHFVKNPTIDLDTVKAMINLDMIGRYKQEKFEIYGVGEAEEFADMVTRAADEAGVTYRAGGRMPGGSDHMPFRRKKIPTLFAFTGLHKQYHRPTDDWDLIDPDGAVRILRLLHSVIGELANMTDGPTRTKPKEAANKDDRRKQDLAKAEPKPATPRSALRVRLGIMPSYGDDDEDGMLIDAVIAGAAAAKGGMTDGDRIIKIGKHDIADIYAYMDAMKQFKPGDEVEIVVVRASEEVTLKITLEAAARRREDG